MSLLVAHSMGNNVDVRDKRATCATVAEQKQKRVKFNKCNDNCKTMPTAAERGIGAGCELYKCPGRGERHARN
jgi:hypothetical protein